MYAIHTTPGFIIGSRPYGEAGKLLSIFTKDFGLVSAAAQGIRLERSKLRYHVQDHSFGAFSLVRGRELWRLTGARAGPEVGGQISGRGLELTARLASLLKRLLHGEEANAALFKCLEDSVRFLEEYPGAAGRRLETLESVTVLRILHALGYVGDGSGLDGVFGPLTLTPEILDSMADKRRKMNIQINTALKESHL